MAVRKKKESTFTTAPVGQSQKKVSGLVGAAHAKAHLLSLIDEVKQNGTPVVITRRGKPQVQIAPLEPQHAVHDVFGCMKGTITINGDIVAPEPDEWDALR